MWSVNSDITNILSEVTFTVISATAKPLQASVKKKQNTEWHIKNVPDFCVEQTKDK